jgi:class 3 adenylate cyclase/tetratricopeptide (TPR) repeat protein
MSISEWLCSLGLGQYAGAFVENAVDWKILPKLSADDLKEIGIIAVGHRRRLLEAIAVLTVTESNVPAPATERRQLTVMFCDVVGSTALAARLDPEDLREVIAAYHHAVSIVVRGFDGFVARYMGDGVLVYFGYPLAHEDDAERAVRAGLDVIDAVGRLEPKSTKLQARVGIATGLVVVGDLIGEGSAQEQSVIGETPNLAARLQALAASGAVVIGGDTRRLVGGLFEVRDLGAVTVKGLTAPILAWQVLRPSIVASRFEALRGSALTRLIGRGEETELLVRRWHQIKAGEGRVVLISGEPGIGKSRLTAELSACIGNEPHIRLRYFCSPHHQETALYPIIVQLERACGFARYDTGEEKLVKLRALLINMPTSEADNEIELIANLLSLPSAAAELDLSPRRKRDRMLEALAGQLDALATQQPVLAIFEDVHWIDPTSRELLDLIVDRVRRRAILLIITFRPEFLAPWTGRPHVTTLGLNRLSSRDGAGPVQSLPGSVALTREIVEDIVARSDGVPLFIEELTGAVLASSNSDDLVATAVSFGGASTLAVPATLRASLLARLDRLSSTAREISQVGAVLGREFTYDLLKEVTQHRDDDLRAALGQLIDAGLLFGRGLPPEATYLFKHALIQDAAYQALLRSRRRELHGRVARTVAQSFPQLVEAQPEVMARHWTEAGEAELAITAWRTAAGLARTRNGLREAYNSYRQGLLLMGTLPTSVDRDKRELELLTELLQIAWAIKGFIAHDTIELNVRATELAKRNENPNLSVQQMIGLWATSLVAGDFPAAAMTADRLTELAEQEGNAASLGLAHAAQLITRMHRGDLLGAEDYFVRGAKFFNEPSFRETLGFSGYTFGQAGHVAWLLGRADVARYRDGLASGSAPSDAYSLAAAQYNSAKLHVFLQDPERVATLAEQAIKLCNEHSFSEVRLWAQMTLGWARTRLGFAEDGAALIRESIATACENGARCGLTAALTWLAEANMVAGSISDALATTEEILTFNPEERLFWPEAFRLRGELWRKQGYSEQAEGDLRKAIRLAQEMSARAWELRASLSLAGLLLSRRNRKEAYDLLAPIYGWFTEGFETFDLKEAKALLTELA